MPKYSIIIPVYNTYNYLRKCLESVINQTYKDYEVIIINDGSSDDSQLIIDEYINKHNYIKCIKQKNQGLSVARNNGIKKSKGKYFLLLDSDDYLEINLLENLNKEIEKNGDIDLLRFQIRNIKQEVIDYHESPFFLFNGKDAFNQIVKYHYVENAWCYLYNKNYFINEKFEYKKGIYHEDFGLTPLVIIKASKVSSIDFIGYNYVERKNSIMTIKSYDQISKKVNDFYDRYLYLMIEISKLKGDYSTFKSFVANSMLIKICELNQKDYKKYLKILKEEKIFENLLDNTLSRKIKKQILKASPKLFYKIVK